MKNLSLVFILIASCISYDAMSQNLIVVQNGNNTSFFNSVPTAVNAAINGDTIYIPGGSWNLGSTALSTILITKTLHIIGTGHNPAYTQVDGICSLVGNLQLRTGASNGSLTGVLLSGRFGNNAGTNTEDAVVNYTLTRCRITNTVALSSVFTWSLFTENVFDDLVDGGNSTNNVFYNNIFANTVSYFSTGNMFKNNVIIGSVSSNEISNSCIFDNNIIFTRLALGTPNNSVFNHNLFVQNFSFPWGTNTGTNNIFNQAQSSIFVSQTGNTFNYTQDYNLQPTCPGKNSGTDGTDIGIYGGIFSWKEGSIPANPHIQFKKIAGNTDQNGNLQINIKVSAQDR